MVYGPNFVVHLVLKAVAVSLQQPAAIVLWLLGSGPGGLRIVGPSQGWDHNSYVMGYCFWVPIY